MDSYDRIIRVSPKMSGGIYWDPRGADPFMREPWRNSARDIPMPYYQAYGQMPDYYMEDQENERDMERMKEMYPDIAKEIAKHVEEECDKMEYEGSMMFDEVPDKVMMRRIAGTIYDKVKDQYQVEETEDQDEALMMNQEARKRYPPRKNWLGDFVETMLYQEIHRRRCRRRGCRRW
ncbi:MAG: hypothetical protein SO016_02635 [Lachnospiraceae bacterium]|nr:hypothetical protein [Robinsoniella sp.]MDY3765581.1 hypothetical protein [Lachnospiraceae bacterium]